MKKNKKLWSFALAGALAVSNLSGVVAAPFTTIVARAAYSTISVGSQSGTVYAGTGGEVTYNIETSGTPDEDEILQLVGNSIEGISTSINENTLYVTVGNSVAAGTYVLGQITSSSTSDPASSSSISLVVSAKPAVVQSVSVSVKNNVKNIPDSALAGVEGLTGNGKDGLIVTAKTTYDVAVDDDTTYSFSFVDEDGKPVADSLFTVSGPTDQSRAEKIDTAVYTVTANTATAGAYTMYVTAGGKSATYSFNVTANPDAALNIYDTNGKSVSSLTVGDKKNLSLWNGELPVSSGVTWAAKEGDEEYITVTSAGAVTALKAGSPEVDASWKMNTDLSLLTALSLTVSEAAADEFAVTYNGSTEATTTIAQGDTLNLALTYGGKSYSATWESMDEKILTVASNGTVTAVKTGATENKAAIVKYSYKDADGVDAVDYVNITVSGIEEVKPAFFVGRTESTGESIKQGETLQIAYKNSDGSKIDGTVTFSSSSKDVTISSNGLITVSKDAEVTGAGSPVVIVPSVDGVIQQDEFEVTIEEATEAVDSYTVEADAETLYFGQSTELTVLKNNEEFTGATLSLGTENADYFTLTGNTIKATKAYSEDDADNNAIGATIVLKVNGKTVDTYEDIVALVDDEYVVKADYLDFTDGATTTDKVAAVEEVEVGDTDTIKASYGATDLTSKMTWESDKPDYVSVSKGKITAKAIAKNIKVTGTYTVNTTTYTVTVSIGSVVGSTGALKSAESAIQNAEIAYDSANDAIDDADKAIAAAEKAKADPTAANLKAAETTLDSAKANLAAAEEAYKLADKNYKAAKAAGSNSDAAVDALASALEALNQAATAVADAEEAVEFAQNTFEEIAPEVEKLKVKEAAISAAETAANAAVANPTDATIKAANDAVATAKEKGATDAELKTATDKIATAEAAKKAADEKAAEEKKAADEKAAAQKEGTVATDAATGDTYKVTSTAGKTVTITATKNAKTVKIGKSVTIAGDEFKVTAIGKKAITGKKVKNVTINASNLKKINKNAFKGAKNLKKVTIKGVKKNSKIAKAIVKAAQKVNKDVKIVYKK